MYKEISEVSMSEYLGFVRVISINIKDSILAKIEFNIEFSNEVGYTYEKEFRDRNTFNTFLQKEVKEVDSIKEVTLRASHLNLLRDLIEGNIKYLEGFSSNTSIEELKENYAYIASNES